MSTKLSIVAVLGLAALPLLPHDAASRNETSQAQAAAAPIEVVRAKKVPLAESALTDPVVQVAARRSQQKRQQSREADDANQEEGPPAAATQPTHKRSAITPAPEPADAAAPTTPQPNTEDALEKTRPQQARLSEPGTAPAIKRHRTLKISAISPAEEVKTPVAPSDGKSEAAQTEPPKPEAWSEADVIAALRECVRVLAPISAEVDISEPMKRQQCGAPAPVLLRRIGIGAKRVEISPPAVVNCAMVASLHTWVEKTLQPAAEQTLGSPVARLRSISGYVCRNRIGSQLHSDRLSEHALANAIDIAGFVTADGRNIDVARHWGPTLRDQREAERVAALQAKGGKTTADSPKASSVQRAEPVKNRKMSAIAQAATEPANAASAKRKKDRSALKTAELKQLGRATSDVSPDPKTIPAPASTLHEDAKNSVEAGFLRRLHKGACGVFGTVLGPEANEAHRDHFHFDLAHRRHSAYCQ